MLTIRALGPLGVNDEHGSLDGEWLRQRAGDVLRILIAERGRATPGALIGRALWGAERPMPAATARQFVFELRNRLEPRRPPGTPSAFVTFEHGGYRLDPDRVWLDVEHFVRDAEAGLAQLRARHDRRARPLLVAAAELHRGDYLAGDERTPGAGKRRAELRALCGDVLRALTDIALRDGDLQAADASLGRSTEFDRYDGALHRRYIALALERAAPAEARARYDHWRELSLAELGEEPDFTLAQLAAELS